MQNEMGPIYRVHRGGSQFLSPKHFIAKYLGFCITGCGRQERPEGHDPPLPIAHLLLQQVYESLQQLGMFWAFFLWFPRTSYP